MTPGVKLKLLLQTVPAVLRGLDVDRLEIAMAPVIAKTTAKPKIIDFFKGGPNLHGRYLLLTTRTGWRACYAPTGRGRR